MDDLVYICTKIARQMDAQGLDRIFDAAEAATSAIEEARPLLQRVVELVDEVSSQPFWHAVCASVQIEAELLQRTGRIPMVLLVAEYCSLMGCSCLMDLLMVMCR